MKVAIIGGGASGLAAAITLKREMPKVDVTIFEKGDDLGKKLLVTGNGRCNLSNFVIQHECYNGDHPLIHTVIDDFDAVEALAFFNSLGLKIREEDGRLYPYSMSAKTVQDLLKIEVKKLKIKTELSTQITEIETANNKYKINNKTYDKVILALGGKVNSDGDGYKILKALNIKYNPITPALVQVKTEENYIKQLKGVRARGVVFLREQDDSDEKPIKYQEGEIQFTEYGLSGIPVMQLSGDIAQMTKKGEKPHINICFTPDLGLKDVNEYIYKQIDSGKEGPELLYGIVNEKIAEVIYTISNGDTNKMALNIMSLPFTAIGTNSFKDAQVTRGGVPAKELKKHSLESKKHPGLYITGELLDVDGFCGGYNLHYAWGSGIKAAREIADAKD